MVTWRDADNRQRKQTVGSEKEAKVIKKRAEEAGKDGDRQRYVRNGRTMMNISTRGDEMIVWNGPKGEDRNGQLTIAGYAPTFLANHSYADDTRRQAEILIAKHLVPALNSKSMKQVKHADVDQFIRQMEADHSGALIARLRSIASTMWTDALRDGIVTINPWIGAKSKRHEARVKNKMTRQQYRAIAAAITEPVYNLVVRTLGESGLRWSEMARLMPGDVVGSTIHVRRSKTRAGVRTVPVTPELASELRAVLPWKSPRTGAHLDYRHFRRDAWNPVVEGMLCVRGCKAPCDVHRAIPFTPHDLRHGHFTWLLAAGWPLVKVRDRAGHSSIAITSIYLHDVESTDDSEALGQLFGAA
jgi:integrase